jgi:hypothetical protein
MMNGVKGESDNLVDPENLGVGFEISTLPSGMTAHHLALLVSVHVTMSKGVGQ